MKFCTVSISAFQTLSAGAGFLNFVLVIESRGFKVCQKNRLRLILMKLGMML